MDENKLEAIYRTMRADLRERIETLIRSKDYITRVSQCEFSSNITNIRNHEIVWYQDKSGEGIVENYDELGDEIDELIQDIVEEYGHQYEEFICSLHVTGINRLIQIHIDY